MKKKILVIGLKEIIVVSHALDEMIPILRRERRHAEGFSGRVEAVPARRFDRVPIGFLQVHDPRLVIQHRASAALVIAVDVVDPVARIQSVVGRHRRADVGDARRPSAVRLVVKHFELVKVRVTEELTGNCRFVPSLNKNIYILSIGQFFFFDFILTKSPFFFVKTVRF